MTFAAPGSFTCVLDFTPLGDWTSVSGLKMSVQSDTIEEGGNFFGQHTLHKTISYDPVTLTRVMGFESNLIPPVFQAQRFNPLPSTAEIIMKAIDGTPIVTWSLQGVRLQSWGTGSLDVNNWGKSQTETLVLTHQGFSAGGLLGGIAAGVKALGL